MTTLHSGGGATAYVEPCQELYGQQVFVPGDISSASYFIAAALLTPGSELLIRNVGTNFTRAGFLKVCEAMGADITLLNKSIEGGEPRSDILAKSSSLKGTIIEGELIPALIDEIPILAVMAACADGTTVIRDAAELKVKETNRIDTVTAGLRAMGVHVTPTDDGMVIEGGTSLKGAAIQSYLDHRIAMAFAVAGPGGPGRDCHRRQPVRGCILSRIFRKVGTTFVIVVGAVVFLKIPRPRLKKPCPFLT